MKSLEIFGCALLFVSLTACKKNLPDGNDFPPALNFVLLDKQGNNLLTSISTPIKVSIVSKGQTVFLGDECAGGGCTMVRPGYSSGSTPPKYAFYYGSLGASVVSSNGTKTFYLELGGKTDTLYYDVQEVRPNNPFDKYDVVSVKFNGKSIAIDQDQLPIYPLRRLR